MGRAGGPLAAALVALGLAALLGAWSLAGRAQGQPSGAGASQSDASLLLAFKASLENGDSVLPDWRAGTDPCWSPRWSNIECDPGTRRVTEL